MIEVKIRRGSAAQNDRYTGSPGVLTIDTDTFRLRVHDGSTLGGKALPNGLDFGNLTTVIEGLGIADINGLNVALSAKIAYEELGAANGVASLDNEAKIPSLQLPSFVDDIVEYSELSAFPVTGERGKIYIAEDTGAIFRWSGDDYMIVSAKPEQTDELTEGTLNLFFTEERVRAAVGGGDDIAYNPTTGVFTVSESINSVNGKDGDVDLTKADVGLSDLDNFLPSDKVQAESATSESHRQTPLSTRQFFESTGMKDIGSKWALEPGVIGNPSFTGEFLHMNEAFSGGRSLAATAVLGDKLYRFGGKDSAGAITTDIQSYDIVTGQTENLGNLTTAHAYSAAAAAWNGKIYLHGGRTSSDLISGTLSVFDPADNSITFISDTGANADDHFLKVHEGVAYIFGGNVQRYLWSLDLATGDKTSLAIPWTSGNASGYYGAAYDDWFYMFNGSSLRRYNIVAKNIETVTLTGSPLPSSLFGDAIVSGDTLYLFGGQGGDNALYSIDLPSHVVTKLGVNPGLSMYKGDLHAYGSSLYAIGGQATGQPIDGVYRIK